jgi:Flp pilus assembly pilin Flp
MSDLMLRTAVITRVNAYSMVHAVARSAQAVVERFQREQTGQDMVEYGGILLVVALVIAAMISLNVPHHIASLVSSAADNVFSGRNSSVTAK